MDEYFKAVYEQFKIAGDISNDNIVGKPLFDTNNIKGQGNVKDILNTLTNGINTTFAIKLKKVRALSDDINNTYDNISAILKNNIGNHKNDVIDVVYYDISINDKKKKTKYTFRYADVRIPFEPIMNKVIYAMANPDKNYTDLKNVEKEVKEFLHNYYWYVSATETVVKKNTEKGLLGNHVKRISKQTNAIYSVLYLENRYIDVELTYVMAIKKAYAECERRYSNDKAAMKIIDEIFTSCLKYTEDAINFNAVAVDQLTQMLKSYEEQINKIYQNIK